jgi:hypothetical protein
MLAEIIHLIGKFHAYFMAQFAEARDRVRGVANDRDRCDMLPPLPDSVVSPEIAAARQDSAEAEAPILMTAAPTARAARSLIRGKERGAHEGR